MSVLLAESYAEVSDLVTDVEVLSTEERNHVLWYACDGGDLSMVKSVIRAGCDVDHFHRGHTPLMMASISGHDDVVKELILAGCKVDLPNSKCFIGWFRFITMVASAWPSLVAWAVAALVMIVLPNMWLQWACYWVLVLTAALHFLSEDSFKVSGMLRMKSWTKYMALAGIVPATVLVWKVVGTTVSEAQFLLPATVLVTLVAVTVLVTAIVLIAVTGVGVVTVAKQVTVTEVVTVATVAAMVVAVALIGTWTKFGPGTEKEELAPGTIVHYIGPDIVGKVVAVTLTLALSLTVAMADAGAVHFAVTTTVTVA